MRRLAFSSVVVALVIALESNALAAQPATSDWKLYTYNASDRALSSSHADAGPSFTFTASTDTALFATAQHDSLAGMTITATFTVAGATGFHYWGEGTADNPCGTPANMRLYFSSNGSMGTNKDWYSNFWWSNNTPLSSQALGNGTFTITATVAPGGWSNWNGKQSTDRPDGFAAAAANPDRVGFSFGGGCFFENGVGADGDATFTLDSFTIN